MAEQDDIFGKIDALLEKRAGFVLQPSPVEDFPVLTDIVTTSAPGWTERRVAERRQGVERRRADRRQTAAQSQELPVGMSEAQFERFLARLERKLEDLFIRQQLRLEEAIRQAIAAERSGAEKKSDKPI